MKSNKVIFDKEVIRNDREILIADGSRSGYLAAIACTVGELRKILEVYSDGALISLHADTDYYRTELEDRSYMHVIEVGEESDADYAQRMRDEEEARVRSDNEAKEKQDAADMRKFLELKAKLNIS